MSRTAAAVLHTGGSLCNGTVLRQVTPVRIKSFSVTEQAFDAMLNPVRAEVSLNLEVLTYEDLPPTHLGHAVFRGNYALLRLAQGRNEEALALAERAVSEAEKRLPEGHWAIATQQSILGEAMAAGGRYREAERILLEANANIAQRLGETTRYAQTSRARLAKLYRAWGRPEQAARYE